MATLSGRRAPVGVGNATSSLFSENVQGRELNRWQHGSLNGVAKCPEPGAFIDKNPIPAFPADRFSGQRACSFFDDFYNRIYIIPGTIDFGAVTEDTARSFIVWNSYLVPKVLESATISDPDGLSLLGPDTPTQYRAFEVVSYQVVASADGPATISTEVNLNFIGLGLFVVPVIGNRAQLWPFAPNWDRPYRVILEYRTEILESHTGKEQRRALRQSPRKRIEYTATLSRDQFRRLRGLMATWQHRAWVFPERSRFTVSTAPMAPQGATLSVAAVPSWVVPGHSVVLEHLGQTEMRAVESVTADSISFSTATDTPWPSGTMVFYGIAGNVETSVQAAAYTSQAAELSVVLVAQPGAEPELPLPGPVHVLGGREVFLHRPNWVNPLSLEFQHQVNSVDYGFGRTSRFTPVKFGQVIRQASFVNQSVTDGDIILDFYRRQRGQQGEFYMPSWEDDMDMAATAVENTSALRVKGTDTFGFYEGLDDFRAILLVLPDGTELLRQVTAISELSDVNGEDTLLTVHEPWPYDFGPEGVTVCWLNVCRLASDGLTLEWLTSAVAQTQLSMKTIEDLPVEDQ